MHGHGCKEAWLPMRYLQMLNPPFHFLGPHHARARSQECPQILCMVTRRAGEGIRGARLRQGHSITDLGISHEW
jgi:hypothetical protein